MVAAQFWESVEKGRVKAVEKPGRPGGNVWKSVGKCGKREEKCGEREETGGEM